VIPILDLFLQSRDTGLKILLSQDPSRIMQLAVILAPLTKVDKIMKRVILAGESGGKLPPF